MIELDAEYRELLQSILEAHCPQAEVRAFGSRVTGSAKPHSDLDLAIVADTALSISELGTLREACQASTLPMRIDIVDWHRISPEFQAVIAAQYEVL